MVVAVTDKKKRTVQRYEVPLDGNAVAAEGGLLITASQFLPHFVMTQGRATSQSDELRNPAAKVHVQRGSEVLFQGWLFGMSPMPNADRRPDFGFALVHAR